MLAEALRAQPIPQRRFAAPALWRWVTRPFASMLLVGIAILFTGLGQGDIRIDGPIYAWVAKRMVISGDWLNLYYDHGQTPYFNKPPLQFWLMAMAFKVLGYSTFSAKLVSVLFGVGCIGMVYAIARLRLEAAVAATAGMALVTTYSFVRNVAAVRLDAAVTFFFLLAIYAGARMLVSREARIRDWVMLGVACGLALMVKSGAALMCLPILIGAFAWNRRWDLLWNWRVSAALLVCAVIVLPWYLHQYHTWGQAFVDQHFRNQMLGRFESATFGASAWYAYLQDLTTRYWPWFPLMIYGGWRILRKRVDGELDRLLIAWGFGALVVLHLLPRKYDRYLLMVYPALAIVAAYGLYGSRGWQIWNARVLPHAGWFLALIGIGVQVSGVRVHSTAYKELAESLPAIRQATERTVYAVKGVPLAIQCSIRFYSDAKVINISDGELQRLKAGDIVVAPRDRDELPTHRTLSEGRHVRFLLLTDS